MLVQIPTVMRHTCLNFRQKCFLHLKYICKMCYKISQYLLWKIRQHYLSTCQLVNVFDAFFFNKKCQKFSHEAFKALIICQLHFADDHKLFKCIQRQSLFVYLNSHFVLYVFLQFWQFCFFFCKKQFSELMSAILKQHLQTWSLNHSAQQVYHCNFQNSFNVITNQKLLTLWSHFKDLSPL